MLWPLGMGIAFALPGSNGAFLPPSKSWKFLYAIKSTYYSDGPIQKWEGAGKEQKNAKFCPFKTAVCHSRESELQQV